MMLKMIILQQISYDTNGTNAVNAKQGISKFETHHDRGKLITRTALIELVL